MRMLDRYLGKKILADEVDEGYDEDARSRHTGLLRPG